MIGQIVPRQPINPKQDLSPEMRALTQQNTISHSQLEQQAQHSMRKFEFYNLITLLKLSHTCNQLL